MLCSLKMPRERKKVCCCREKVFKLTMKKTPKKIFHEPANRTMHLHIRILCLHYFSATDLLMRRGGQAQHLFFSKEGKRERKKKHGGELEKKNFKFHFRCGPSPHTSLSCPLPLPRRPTGPIFTPKHPSHGRIALHTALLHSASPLLLPPPIIADSRPSLIDPIPMRKSQTAARSLASQSQSTVKSGDVPEPNSQKSTSSRLSELPVNATQWSVPIKRHAPVDKTPLPPSSARLPSQADQAEPAKKIAMDSMQPSDASIAVNPEAATEKRGNKKKKSTVVVVPKENDDTESDEGKPSPSGTPLLTKAAQDSNKAEQRKEKKEKKRAKKASSEEQAAAKDQQQDEVSFPSVF